MNITNLYTNISQLYLLIFSHDGITASNFGKKKKEVPVTIQHYPPNVIISTLLFFDFGVASNKRGRTYISILFIL